MVWAIVASGTWTIIAKRGVSHETLDRLLDPDGRGHGCGDLDDPLAVEGVMPRRPTRGERAVAARKLKLRPAPKQVQRRVLKGQVSERARATIFARQQREQRIRSIIGRKGRGKLTPEQQAELRRKTFTQFQDRDVIDRRSVNSSWVAEILLVMWQGQPALGVKFHNGVIVVYTQTTLKDFQLMAAAGSKGKFIWARYYKGIPGAGSPYIVL